MVLDSIDFNIDAGDILALPLQIILLPLHLDQLAMIGQLLRMNRMELLQSHEVSAAVNVGIVVNLGDVAEPTEHMRHSLVVSLIIEKLPTRPDTLEEVLIDVLLQPRYSLQLLA